AMVELTRTLVEKNPEGPIFRGPRGNTPYSRNAVRIRFRRLRQKLPHLAGVVAYSYRHTYCTDALVNGVGVAQVAEWLGHAGTDMVPSVYSNLSDQVAQLPFFPDLRFIGGDTRQHPGHEPSGWGAQIEALPETDEADAELLQLIQERQQALGGAAQP